MRRLVLLAAPAVLLLAGCGGSGSDSAAYRLDPVSQAARKTELQTARIDVSVLPALFSGTHDLRGSRGTGVLDERRQIARMRLADEDGDASFDEILSGHELFVPSHVLYVSRDTRPWVKFEIGAGDPGQPVTFVRAVDVAAPVTRLGPGNVGGAPATRYAKTVAGQRYEVWIGRGGLIRRVQAVWRSSQLHTQLTATIDLHDFGVPVGVRTPSPSQIAVVRGAPPTAAQADDDDDG